MAAGGKTDFLENAILNDILRGTDYVPPDPSYVGLFTTLPSDAGTGGAEVTGGSYARVGVARAAASWSNPSGLGVSNQDPIVFPQATAYWGLVVGFGVWSASSAGNLLYYGELLGPEKIFTVDPATDTFTSTGHGLADNVVVRIRNTGGNLPAGLSETVDYFVINSAANTFQLSETSGGSAVNITSAGDGINAAHASYIQPVNNGNVFSFSAGSLSIIEG